MIIKEVKKAFWNLYKNPTLFIPDLVFIFLTWIAFQLLLPYSGIQTLIEAGENAFTNEILSVFYQNHFMKFIITLLIFTFVTFIFGVVYQIIKYNMIKEVIKNRKANLFLSWQRRKTYFWKVVYLKIYVFLLSAIVSILIGGMGALTYFIVSLFSSNTLIISSYIIAVISLIMIILVRIGILFRYPALFLKKEKPLNALKISFKLFKKKPKFVIGVWLIMIAVTLAFTLITIILHAFDSALQLTLGNFAVFTSIIFGALFILLELIPILWADLFLFSIFSKLKNL